MSMPPPFGPCRQRALEASRSLQATQQEDDELARVLAESSLSAASENGTPPPPPPTSPPLLHCPASARLGASAPPRRSAPLCTWHRCTALAPCTAAPCTAAPPAGEREERERAQAERYSVLSRRRAILSEEAQRSAAPAAAQPPPMGTSPLYPSVYPGANLSGAGGGGSAAPAPPPPVAVAVAVAAALVMEPDESLPMASLMGGGGGSALRSGAPWERYGLSVPPPTGAGTAGSGRPAGLWSRRRG